MTASKYCPRSQNRTHSLLLAITSTRLSSESWRGPSNLLLPSLRRIAFPRTRRCDSQTLRDLLASTNQRKPYIRGALCKGKCDCSSARCLIPNSYRAETLRDPCLKSRSPPGLRREPGMQPTLKFFNFLWEPSLGTFGAYTALLS